MFNILSQSFTPSCFDYSDYTTHCHNLSYNTISSIRYWLPPFALFLAKQLHLCLFIFKIYF